MTGCTKKVESQDTVPLCFHCKFMFIFFFFFFGEVSYQISVEIRIFDLPKKTNEGKGIDYWTQSLTHGRWLDFLTISIIMYYVYIYIHLFIRRVDLYNRLIGLVDNVYSKVVFLSNVSIQVCSKCWSITNGVINKHEGVSWHGF